MEQNAKFAYTFKIKHTANTMIEPSAEGLSPPPYFSSAPCKTNLITIIFCYG